MYDASRLHPELRTDDYVVIRPDALFAAIEVKSTLTFYRQEMKAGEDPLRYPIQSVGKRYRWAGTLVEALENIKSIKDVCPQENRAFFGVFGYSASFDWKNVYQALDSGGLQSQLGVKHVDQFPPVICVPAKFLINISPYDLQEQAPHHDPYRSHFNYIGATEAAPAYPLQFFTTYFLNHVGNGLNGCLPRGGGINSGAAPGAVDLWGHHFDLNSEGHEDQ